MSLCTTTHPLHTRFTKIFGASISEATTRPNPRRRPAHGPQARARAASCAEGRWGGACRPGGETARTVALPHDIPAHCAGCAGRARAADRSSKSRSALSDFVSRTPSTVVRSILLSCEVLPPIYRCENGASAAQRMVTVALSWQSHSLRQASSRCSPTGRVRPHRRFRNRGTESLSECGMEWMSAGAKRQCDRALHEPGRRPRRRRGGCPCPRPSRIGANTVQSRIFKGYRYLFRVLYLRSAGNHCMARAGGARARDSVNFRNFSPCIARARRARAGLTVYPPSWTLACGTVHGTVTCYMLAFDE